MYLVMVHLLCSALCISPWQYSGEISSAVSDQSSAGPGSAQKLQFSESCGPSCSIPKANYTESASLFGI